MRKHAAGLFGDLNFGMSGAAARPLQRSPYKPLAPPIKPLNTSRPSSAPRYSMADAIRPGPNGTHPGMAGYMHQQFPEMSRSAVNPGGHGAIADAIRPGPNGTHPGMAGYMHQQFPEMGASPQLLSNGRTGTPITRSGPAHPVPQARPAPSAVPSPRAATPAYADYSKATLSPETPEGYPDMPRGFGDYAPSSMAGNPMMLGIMAALARSGGFPGALGALGGLDFNALGALTRGSYADNPGYAAAQGGGRGLQNYQGPITSSGNTVTGSTSPSPPPMPGAVRPPAVNPTAPPSPAPTAAAPGRSGWTQPFTYQALASGGADALKYGTKAVNWMRGVPGGTISKVLTGAEGLEGTAGMLAKGVRGLGSPLLGYNYDPTTDHNLNGLNYATSLIPGIFGKAAPVGTELAAPAYLGIDAAREGYQSWRRGQQLDPSGNPIAQIGYGFNARTNDTLRDNGSWDSPWGYASQAMGNSGHPIQMLYAYPKGVAQLGKAVGNMYGSTNALARTDQKTIAYTAAHPATNTFTGPGGQVLHRQLVDLPRAGFMQNMHMLNPDRAMRFVDSSGHQYDSSTMPGWLRQSLSYRDAYLASPAATRASMQRPAYMPPEIQAELGR